MTESRLKRIDDLLIGTAAEHLVCADILMNGHLAFLSEQHCPYDLVVEIEGIGLLRVQVKSTREVRSIPQRKTHIPSYMWHVRRAGKGGERLYKEDEFDVLALVALDIKRIAYILPDHVKQTIHIRPPSSDRSVGKHFDDYTFSKMMEGLINE